MVDFPDGRSSVDSTGDFESVANVLQPRMNHVLLGLLTRLGRSKGNFMVISCCISIRKGFAARLAVWADVSGPGAFV